MCMVCEEVVWCGGGSFCVVTEWGESFSIYSDSGILIKFAEVFNYISLEIGMRDDSVSGGWICGMEKVMIFFKEEKKI